MSSSETCVTTKRQRTVEGSCWPCKRRRVKCDLRKPSCRRCILYGTTCNYSVLDVRWSMRRIKIGDLSEPNSENVPSPLQITLKSDDCLLAYSERRALDYFVARLWPLLSISRKTCPPPISLALQCKPVLQTVCVFADTHLAMHEGRTLARTLTYQRLSCLASIREHLEAQIADHTDFFPLLTAILLLYLLDGFVDCAQQHASTQSHYSGALALIETLGGFQNVRAVSSKETCMLLSQFASTDLTGAILQGRKPYLPLSVWHQVELRPVWWEVNHWTLVSLASIFEVMAEISVYLHSNSQSGEFALEQITAFERRLQPTYLVLGHVADLDTDTEPLTEYESNFNMATNSLCRAFQHAALIYLYRAISGLPTSHSLVQQHVQACLDCIRGIDISSKVQNCALFPLYVAGAHARTKIHRKCVLENLDKVFANLRFESVLCVRSNLELLWQSDHQMGSWSETFKNYTNTTLVL